MADEGWSWGIDPNPEANIIEYGWDGVDQGEGSGDISPWRVEESSTISANWSAALGTLRFSIGDSYVSDVMNKGDATSQNMQVSENSTTTHLLQIQWRGDSSTFNQWDTTPVWESYPTGGANKTWQYVQVKVKCLEAIEISGEGITIGGEPVGM